MDKPIHKKKWTTSRVLLISGLPVLFIILILLAFNSRESVLKINKSKVSISKVAHDDFQDMITFQGSVEPVRTIQIDAVEGGVVEEIYVENGSTVEAEQPLMKLKNTALNLDFMNRETQIVEQINNLRSTRISLDQNKRQVQEQLVDISYQLKEQRRQWSIDSTLFHEGAISETTYQASKANYSYLIEKEALLNERLNTDELYRKSQLHSIDASIEMMERNLSAIRQNLENLIIKAPISGQLNSFDHEIGETKQRSTTLGRVDVLTRYLISAQVDQYYLNRMDIGQKAKVEFGATEHELEITKIFPTINNGQFEVHLNFVTTDLPPTIRRGQTVQVRLELSAVKKALIVKRGSFSQTNNGKYVYVLTDDNTALKRPVKFGIQNPEFIEILEGLEENELVITSSYSNFGDTEKIILTP